MKMRPSVLLVTACLAAAACGRLDQVGKAPGFSSVGGGDTGPIVSPARAAIAVPPPVEARRSYSRSSLWSAGPTSLFGDRRAQSLGDILTVVIEIDDAAQISNSSNRSRAGSESAGAPDLLGVPQVLDGLLPSGASFERLATVNSSSSYKGNGSVSRNEQIELRVAATVIDVLPNGHFVIQGDQEVRVNFELRDLRVTGIVRPEDISRRNEITYDKIAGARIAYGGRGQISDVQQPRYGQQVTDIVLPF
jgi:flagellar L-ring protein precursor FlgH